MKKYSIIASVFALFVMFTVFACEKAIISENNEEDTPKGNLRVSVSQIEKTSFSALTRAAVADVCTRLNFAVYDEDGTRLKLISQTSDKEDYGTCSFQLAAGTYQLVVVGHSSNGNPSMADPYKIQFTNSQGFTDTFLCYGSITIGEDPVDLELTLNRIVALCRFVITDEFPADVKKLRFYYSGGSGAFDATTGFGCVNSKQDVKFDVVATQKQFDLYTFLHDTEGTIHLTVTAYDSADNVLYERTFDVPMQQNHITWLTGAFFTGSGASPTTITGVTVNTDWAGETYLTF